jgi:hypothetical protein
MRERQVASLEPMDISQDFMLGMIAMEDLVRQVRTRSREVGRKRRIDGSRQFPHAKRKSFMTDEYFHQPLYILRLGRLIQRNTQRIVVVPPKIQALFVRTHENLFALSLGESHSDRIEEFLAADIEPELP